MSTNRITPEDLTAYGIQNVTEIVYNPSYDYLYQ